MSWHANALTYLKTTPLAHHHFIQTIEEVEALLLSASPGEMIIIHGPTRAGKTYLSRELANRLYGSLNPHGDDLPFAMVTAANASTAGSFSTRSFTRKALMEVRHPMYSSSEVEENVDRFSSSLSRIRESDMRDDLISALRYRHVDTLFVDEWQNIRFVSGGPERAAWFFESLKCVASEANIKMVVIGTYELLPIRDRCSQLVGRSDTVHFPRYKCETLEETCHWEQALETYSTCLSFKGTSESLRCWSERLHQLTFGCVGLLNKTLRSAIAYSKLSGSRHFSLDHIERSKKDPRERDAVWQSICFGEQYLADPNKILGLEDYVWDKKTSLFVADKRRPKRGHKAFQRRPRRYGPNDRMKEQP